MRTTRSSLSLACVRAFLEAIQFLTIERLGEPAARARSLEVIWPRVPQPIEEVSGRSETIGVSSPLTSQQVGDARARVDRTLDADG